MKKFSVIFILVLMLVACSSNNSFTNMFKSNRQISVANYQKAKASVMFNNMDGYWQHRQSADVNGVEINTFIPTKETSENWQEKIEINHLKVSKSMTAKKYYNIVVKHNFVSKCKGSESSMKILHEMTNDLMYQFDMKMCLKKANGIIIGRIMRSKNSISIISYIFRTNKLTSEQYQKMYELINQAKVIGD